MIGNKISNTMVMITLALSALISSVSCAKSNYQDNFNVNPFAADTELCFASNGVCVNLTWDKMQTDTEYGEFTLKFYKKGNPTVFVEPGYTPFVKVIMPSMGHGSSPITTQKVADGIYKSTNVYFSMPGDWEIRIQIRDGVAVMDQVIQKFNYAP